MRRQLTASGPMLLSLVILAVAAAEHRILRTPASDAGDYHRRVREAIDATPYTIDNWVGKDMEVPPAAVELLHPNAILSRKYHNVRTGDEALMLFVHCRDVRDLLGHYPPVCYPANGWTLRKAEVHETTIAEHTIHLTRYHFTRDAFTSSQPIAIWNFLILPHTGTSADMTTARRSAQDYSRRHFGATQVQLIVSAHMRHEQQQRVFKQFIEANPTLLNRLTKPSEMP